MSYIQPYQVWLPSRGNGWDDDFDSWIERSYTAKRHEGLYDSVERDFEDDVLPAIPTGSILDDICIDAEQEIVLNSTL